MIGVTYTDECQRRVKPIQRPPPISPPSLTATDIVKAKARLRHTPRIQRRSPTMEQNNECHKPQNDSQLQTQASHVDMQAILDRLRISRRIGHQTADGLHDEGQDIGADEYLAQEGGLDAADALLGDVEVYHAGQRHVDEGVDPDWREEEEDGVGHAVA